jgi:hypothetical protein
MGKPPKPVPPPAVPQIDTAAQMVRSEARMLRRGRGTTILTSEGGLPDLGTTTTPVAGG